MPFPPDTQSNISALQPTEDAGGTGLPRSCREIIDRNASAASGRYRIRPSSDLPPVAVYCDHDFYGGGWSLVQKISTGNWQTTDTSTLHRQALDPLSNTNQARLYDTSMAGVPFVASLNRAYTNGIARYSNLYRLDKRPYSRVPSARLEAHRSLHSWRRC